MLWTDFGANRISDQVRVFVADTWRVGSAVTLNYGAAYLYEPNGLNHNLPKPALLTAVLGPDGLAAPRVGRGHLTPAGGLAWSLGGDGRTGICRRRGPVRRSGRQHQLQQPGQ